MFEQDYIMRLIKEMIRTILKLLFNIDTESPTSELLKDSELEGALDELLDMVDMGNIGEAENKMLSMVNGEDKRNLQFALLFYSYLNNKDDEFLLDNNFSREEIKQGIKDVASKYGLGSLSEVFLSDI